MTTRPLDGIRVLDFTRVLSGPHATRMLCDLGAEVIKVEPPDGDITRMTNPRINGLATYFVQQNVGKRNISVDTDKPEAVELLLRLADRCDVLIENFRPGVMDRIGLGYDVVAAATRGIVYASINGYGSSGPVGVAPGVRPGGRCRDRDHQGAGRCSRRPVRQRPVQPRRRVHGARNRVGHPGCAVQPRAHRVVATASR